MRKQPAAPPVAAVHGAVGMGAWGHGGMGFAMSTAEALAAWGPVAMRAESESHLRFTDQGSTSGIMSAFLSP